jgi:protein ImuB
MFACLYAPDFPVQAVLQLEPRDSRAALKQSPVAVLDGPASLPRIFALNSAARRAGIEPGMTKLQVETYGGVALRKRSLEAEESAQNGLLDLAAKFSPRVESTSPGALIVDLAGTGKLLGGPREIALKITAGASELGFDLYLAVASNPDAAFHAARGFPGITILHLAEEAGCLAPLPVSILPASPEILEILEGWGIRTFQALAGLPQISIVERLGQEGLSLQKLARGENHRPLLTVVSAREFVESFEFDDPVETLESVFFILNRLLEQLCSRLISDSLATSVLRLTIDLEVRQLRNAEEGERYQHEWKLPFPTQNHHTLFGLVRLHLENTTFSAPVRKLALEVAPIKPRVAQGDLFAPPTPEPEKLEITLERVRGVVGSADEKGIACIGSPEVLDTHKPDSFAVHPFSSLEHESEPSVKAPCLALRIFRPALETRVELDGNRPHFVWLWSRHRRVLAASGPWRASGD